jgi:hypothetical protein
MDSSEPETISFEVADVTSTFTLSADNVQRSAPAGAVAAAFASRMSLPEAPWAFRHDSTAEYLDERQAIGEQVTPGERLTLAPRTHLGAI